jgi:hypothetical protein
MVVVDKGQISHGEWVILPLDLRVVFGCDYTQYQRL